MFPGKLHLNNQTAVHYYLLFEKIVFCYTFGLENVHIKVGVKTVFINSNQFIIIVLIFYVLIRPLALVALL